MGLAHLEARMARSGWGWLAVVALAACGDGGDDAPRDLSTVEISAEGALPEGSWSGAVATRCDGEDEAEARGPGEEEGGGGGGR